VTPKPGRLYVHDDLTEIAGQLHERCPDARPLVAALFAAMGREPHVAVLSLGEQLAGVLAQGTFAPFATTIAIGGAGERVAARLHARAGWFPSVIRGDVRREEDGTGDYVLTSPAPLADQLAVVTTGGAVADDTLFTGLTMRSVLSALPRGVLERTHAFCLRGVAESIPAIQRLCPITVGFAAPGRILDDVSFINASGLVRRGAIRRVGAPPLALFEREEWMAAWFPRSRDEVMTLCRRLHGMIDAGGRP
jgi:hypothetical protein